MKKKNHLIFMCILVLVVILSTLPFMSACATKPAATGPIKIGCLFPLTGPFAMWGGWFNDGVPFALDEVNWQVAGREIKVIIEDEGGEDVSIALEKAKKLVEQDKVDIIVGPFYGSSRIAVYPYTSKVPILAVCQVNTAIPEAQNEYCVWTAQSYVDTQRPLGLYAYEKLGLRTMVGLGSDYSCPYEFTQGVTDAFQEQGGKVLQQQWAALTETDYSPYLVSMKPADALVSTCLGPPAMMTLYKQLAQLGLNKKYRVLQAEDGAVPQFVMDEIGEEMLGTMQSNGYHYKVDNPINKKFVAAFQAKFNRMPEAMDAYNYVAFKTILAGLEATGGDTDPAKLYKAMVNLKLDTIEGPVSFIPEGQPIVNHYILEVQKQDGKYTQQIVDIIKSTKPQIYRGTPYKKFEDRK